MMPPNTAAVMVVTGVPPDSSASAFVVTLPAVVVLPDPSASGVVVTLLAMVVTGVPPDSLASGVVVAFPATIAEYHLIW